MLQQLLARMRADGFVHMHDIVNPERIEAARTAFLQRYERLLTGAEQPGAMLVGGRRHMITLDIAPPFDDETFLANGKLLPLLKALLGEDLVLANFGVVCSLPGASEQQVHCDGGVLFPETPLDALLPAPAITLALPLLEMNQAHGTTRLFGGSHRSQEATGAPFEPVVREGDALMWDYRLLHAGTANLSMRPRPLLYATYCRSWFFDARNFTKQPPLRIDAQTRAALSEACRRLLARA